MTSDYWRPRLVSILLVAIVCDYVTTYPCPAVDNCLLEFTENMKQAGHVTDEYCPVIAQVIACLKKGECSTETQKHKDTELKHFETDPICSAGEKLGPGISMFIIYTFWRVLYQH